MNEKKKPFINYTPVGILSYPKLNKPDVPTLFKGASTYQTTILLKKDDEGVAEFMEKLTTHVLSDLKEGDYSPVKDLGDSYSIKVKRKSDFGQPKFLEPKPDGEFGSNLLDKAPGLIWSGTEASVSFTSYRYATGVTFALCGVCIHKLVEPEKQDKEPEIKSRKSAVDSPFGD